MPGSFNPTYNPADVMLSKDAGQNKGPYMNIGARPNIPAHKPSLLPKPNVLGAQAVRATGAGPFDSAYRQDLATYAGGDFARPGGHLSFNPTGPMFGQPTGAGSAPVPGMPTDLLTQALGGAPFDYSPPKPKTTTKPTTATRPPWWQNWGGRTNFGRGGGFFGY